MASMYVSTAHKKGDKWNKVANSVSMEVYWCVFVKRAAAANNIVEPARQYRPVYCRCICTASAGGWVAVQTVYCILGQCTT